MPTATQDSTEVRILGVNFFVGDAEAAIQRISDGGLLVVPAAPALKDLGKNARYRDALLNADLAITDSAFMVLSWNLLERTHITRLSGLNYLRRLLEVPEVRRPGNTFWIMAGPASAKRNLDWLARMGIEVADNCVYHAPMYSATIDDSNLIQILNQLRPRHVVVTVGGGTQEPLGIYLKRNLDFLPAIHCIGAAIAFLSGDQVRIPEWADRLYLGWLFRCLSAPQRYIPRYWEARKLFGLMYRYRSELPECIEEGAAKPVV